MSTLLDRVAPTVAMVLCLLLLIFVLCGLQVRRVSAASGQGDGSSTAAPVSLVAGSAFAQPLG